MDPKNYSATYRLLRNLGIYLSPEKYGQFSFGQFLGSTIRLWKNELLHALARDMAILEPFSSRPLRPFLHHWRGVKMGKGVFMGLQVMFDSVYPERIQIGDGCIITNRVQLLAHNRDLSTYGPGKKIGDCGYVVKDIIIENNVVIGTESLILPGVRIGEGAVVSAKSMVNKDVPPYTMVAGIPAKTIKDFNTNDGG